MKKLSHFRNAVVLAGTIILASSALIAQETAPMVNDTIWGTGYFAITDTNNTPVVGANVACTAVDIPGDTIPDNYTMNFTDAHSNFIYFELPAMIDLGVGVEENKAYKEASVAPNPSPDFTFAFHGKPTSDLLITNMNGKIVKKVPINYDNSRNISGAYVDMSTQDEGAYIYKVQTENGVLSGKIIKNIGAKANDLGSKILEEIAEEETNNFKRLGTYEATYNTTVTAEGYEDLNTEQTITDGNNGWISYILKSGSGDPEFQYIGGTTWDDNATSPLPGVTVNLYNNSNNQLIESMTTDENGEYLTSEGIPTGTNVRFDVGGVAGKYSFVGDLTEIPDELEIESDTLKDVYHYVMYDKSRQVPGTSIFLNALATHIGLMTGDGQVEGALRGIEFYLGNSLPENIKQGTRSNYNLLKSHIGAPGMYTESSTELNQDLNGYDPYTNPKPVGINIELGSNSTQANQVAVITPLENELEPYYRAEMVINTTTYNTLAHENGRAYGLNEVSWASIMDAYGSVFTNEDKVIWNLAVTHDKNVYDKGKAYFTLENIAENIFAGNSSITQDAELEYEYEYVPNKP